MLLRNTFRDLRYAPRQLRKPPGFTVAAILTLALGIGATTAIFTAIYATLLAPMPYLDHDKLVVVWSRIQGDRNVLAAVHSVDPRIALATLLILEKIMSLNLGGDRLFMTLMGAFTFIALVLAAVGVYGVMAFTVGQREHEIGLSMALGATRGSVVSIVLKEALILACIGLGIGLTGAFFIGRSLHSILYSTGTNDYGTLACVSAVLLCASVFASLLPARRAASVEPVQALRTE